MIGATPGTCHDERVRFDRLVLKMRRDPSAREGSMPVLQSCILETLKQLMRIRSTRDEEKMFTVEMQIEEISG